MQEQIKQGYRLSPQQEYLWLLQGGPSASQYRVMCAIKIEGELRKDILIAALTNIIERHEILRTSFRTLPGMTIPLQVIGSTPSMTLHERDLTGFDFHAQEAELESLWDRVRTENFDLEQEAPLHAHLVAKSAHECALILVLPALCGDMATLKNIVSELALSYRAAMRREERATDPLQYIVVSEWQP
jgi:hypothetical protein